MPWPIAAMGIGALIGGLGAKQRGGNFLKGALTGAALGGVTGGLGGHYGTALGTKGAGIFGLGTKMLPNMLALSGIGMGTEMFGQQEANKKALEGRRRLFNEEEEERLRRLSEIAGYNVADPTQFLTPQSYFGAARGGLAELPHYANGGFHDVPMEESGPTMDPEIMRLPMGQEGSFEEENEGIVGLELAGLTDEEMSELQALQSLSIVTPEDHPQYEKIQLRLQELMGRMKVAKGGHINRPGYFLGGLSGLLRSGKAGDMAEWYDKELIEDQEDMAEWYDKELEGVYDRNLEQVKDFIGDEEGFDYRSLMLGPPRGEDTGASGDSKKKLGMVLKALRAITPMAEGGQVNRPHMFLGGALGLAGLLGGAGLLSKVFGKKGEKAPIKKPIIEKLPIRPPGNWYPDDDDDPKIGLPRHLLLNKAQGGQINRPGYKFGGGIDWSKVQSAMTNTGGFDTSGGEQLWQARNVANTDPGVYQKGWFGGSSLTSGGENVNQAAKDWQNWRKGKIGSAYSPGGAKHIYNENYLRDFEEKYPGASGLGMTGMDVFNQQLLEDEAPEGYTYAQGGIADLDMRGGGESIGPGTGTSDDVPAMLSDGEFVMTANAVSNLGGGNRMLGAKRMYNMMNSLDPNSQTPGEMNTVGYG